MMTFLLLLLILLQTNQKKATKRSRNGELKKIAQSKQEKFRLLKKLKRYKKLLNKNKRKPRRQSRLEDKISNQSYDCDVYGYTKAASVSRTQYSRTKRIQKFAPKLEKYSYQSNTIFDSTLALMNMTTDNGTTCQGAPLNATGVEVYTTLAKCKDSVPTVCNLSLVSSYNTAVFSNISACQPLLKTFGNTFKVCWTQLF